MQSQTCPLFQPYRNEKYSKTTLAVCELLYFTVKHYRKTTLTVCELLYFTVKHYRKPTLAVCELLYFKALP